VSEPYISYILSYPWRAFKDFCQWLFLKIVNGGFYLWIGVMWLVGGTAKYYDCDGTRNPKGDMPVRDLIKTMWGQRREH
jgi:hypothetical protein